MSSISKNRPAKTDWPTMVLVSLSFAIMIAMPTASVPVLFKEIAGDLNLDVVQVGSIWGMISLGSIFVTPVGGVLCDRLGAARSIVVIGMLSGLVGATRSFSNSYAALMATTFLWGLVSAAMSPALTMSASLSSSEQKQGLAQGFMGVGGGLGVMLGSMMSATVLSPLVGGWRNVFLLYGGIAVLTSLIWLLRRKSLRNLQVVGQRTPIPFFQSVTRVLRLKEFWVIGLSLMAFQACITGMQGYLPYYLQGIGWSAVAAGGALAVYSGAGTFGVIPMSLLSDRLGSRKVCLYISFVSTIIGTGLISTVHGSALWVLVIMAGVFYQTNSALFVAMCFETVPVGPSYSGTALGMLLSMGLIGRAFSPPLGNSLADISQTIAWPFIFWAGLGIVGMIVLVFVKERHRRGPRVAANIG